MTALSILYVILFYVAMITLVVGVTNKILQYIRVPAPLKIAVTPAPLTKTGVVYRFFTEIVLFNSLWRATKWTWIFGWVFHLSLLLAFFRHLRYVISPDSLLWPLVDLQVVQSFGQIPEAIAHQIGALIRPYLDVVLFRLNRNEPGVCW